MIDTFTCEVCDGTFEKGWTDEEAQVEMQEFFGPLQPEDQVIVCDDCFKKMQAFFLGNDNLKIIH